MLPHHMDCGEVRLVYDDERDLGILRIRHDYSTVENLSVHLLIRILNEVDAVLSKVRLFNDEYTRSLTPSRLGDRVGGATLKMAGVKQASVGSGNWHRVRWGLEERCQSRITPD